MKILVSISFLTTSVAVILVSYGYWIKKYNGNYSISFVSVSFWTAC